jgi:hypothetical protein
VTIKREVEIEVTALVLPEEPQTWTDPGDPGDVSIESAIFVATEQPCELTEKEIKYVKEHAEDKLADGNDDDYQYERLRDRKFHL